MDLLTAYRRSLAEFTDRVELVTPQLWSAPTPCTNWDVRELVNHVVGEEFWVVPLFAGRTVAEVGDELDGDLLGEDPIATALEAARAAEEAVAADGALERTVDLSRGPTPARDYVSELLADHVIHAWDLAAAIGADRRLDPELVEYCADWFAPREKAYRGYGVIAARVEQPTGADRQDQLIGAFGRSPEWPK